MVSGQRILLKHRNGVPWYDAPIPRKWHFCRAWSSGWVDLTQLERCACGAQRDVYQGRWSPWVWKNTRRNGPRDTTPI